jgi:hypothetical protein
MLKGRGLPIIVVQAGDFLKVDGKQYLDLALRQAARASPDNDLILLTDVLRPGLPEITQVMLADYRRSASRFEEIYRHASVNPLDYERFCFARWFSVREFAQRHGIERFCVLDSDILLFSPIEAFVAEFAGYQAGNWTWANVITASALDVLCDHFETVFRDHQLLSAIAEKYRVGAIPHLSDMVALFELAEGNPAFLDQNGLPAKGFDDNIHSSVGGLFTMDGPIKLLTTGADGVPVARCARSGSAVPFRFLHFQGPAKPLMAKFVWQPTLEAQPA